MKYIWPEEFRLGEIWFRADRIAAEYDEKDIERYLRYYIEEDSGYTNRQMAYYKKRAEVFLGMVSGKSSVQSEDALPALSPIFSPVTTDPKTIWDYVVAASACPGKFED